MDRREADLTLPGTIIRGFVAEQEGKGVVPVAERTARDRIDVAGEDTVDE